MGVTKISVVICEQKKDEYVSVGSTDRMAVTQDG